MSPDTPKTPPPSGRHGGVSGGRPGDGPRTITKKELVARIAERAAQTKVVASDIIQMFLDEIIDELYLSAMARTPSAAERDVARRTLAADRARGAEDLLWALLNSAEFLVNR